MRASETSTNQLVSKLADFSNQLPHVQQQLFFCAQSVPISFLRCCIWSPLICTDLTNSLQLFHGQQNSQHAALLNPQLLLIDILMLVFVCVFKFVIQFYGFVATFSYEIQNTSPGFDNLIGFSLLIFSSVLHLSFSLCSLYIMSHFCLHQFPKFMETFLQRPAPVQ